MRRGIVIGDTGDLKVQVVRNAVGVIVQGLVVGENDCDCVQLLSLIHISEPTRRS